MKKIIALLLALTCALALFAGCAAKTTSNDTAADTSAADTAAKDDSASTEKEDKQDDAASTKKELSGTVATDGSTSMEKVIGALGESFMAENPNVTFTYNPTGSGSGIQAVSEGRCDIGLSSRALKDEEKASGLKETTLALDGIAIIVNPENPVSDLDVETIAKIYTGEITNWKDVGGNDACQYRQELTSTGDVIATVAQNPDAIGYASLSAVKDTVKALTVGGVAPSEDTVKDGSYVVQRPFVLVTKDGEALSEAAQAFYDYALDPAQAELIGKAGAVAVN